MVEAANAPAYAAHSIPQYSQVQHCVFLGVPVHVLFSALPLHLRVDTGWPRREVSLRYGSHGRNCVSLQLFSEPLSCVSLDRYAALFIIILPKRSVG